MGREPEAQQYGIKASEKAQKILRLLDTLDTLLYSVRIYESPQPCQLNVEQCIRCLEGLRAVLQPLPKQIGDAFATCAVHASSPVTNCLKLQDVVDTMSKVLCLTCASEGFTLTLVSALNPDGLHSLSSCTLGRATDTSHCRALVTRASA